MTEKWESDGLYGEFGPIEEDDWVVEAYYCIPIDTAQEETDPLLGFIRANNIGKIRHRAAAMRPA